MPDLSNKTILILSPQAWGKMYISKHHYAIELAKRGNKVYFLNPPEQGEKSVKKSIEVKPSGIQNSLFFIEHRLFFPYSLKFRLLFLFHLLMRIQINRILKEIKEPIDVVWSFDIGHLYPFSFFGTKPFKLFHPVDEPRNSAAIAAATGAQIIFSVTHEISQKYQHLQVPTHFINHGVVEEFFLHTTDNKKMNDPIRIGFSGNLLRQDIDRPVLLEIIKGHPTIVFEFWGSYSVEQTNIGGEEDLATVDFVSSLKASSNVVLHGAVDSGQLARSVQAMDAFLICYDVQRDQSKGTNYHKVMEYLATGKVIISNNVSTYRDRPELIQMIEGRMNNSDLPQLFGKVINQLNEYNQPECQRIRRDYARDNTYPRQIEKIESKLIAFDVLK